MPYRLLLVLFYVLFSYTATAQNKTNFALAKKVHNEKTNKDEAIHMLIQGDVKQIEVLVKAAGGTFKYAAGDIASVSISINQLSKIMSDKAVKRIEAFPPKIKPLNDTILCHNNVLPVHAGQAPLTQGYDGTGVIIGFIDFGIDYNHPDFKDSLGKSRILWLWDQTKPKAGNTPMPYNYGQQWSNTDIDNGLCTENPSNTSGHGTHVAGVAAGNGLATGGFLGTAPKADIIMVYYSDSLNPPLTDAVSYIYNNAQSVGKPCVINASIGVDYGLHDGRDAVSQAMKNLIIARPGQAFVAAAGNNGSLGNIHLAYTVSPVDTNFTMFSPASGLVYFDIVADSNNLKNIQFAIGADEMSPVYSFRGNIPFVKVSSIPIQTLVATSLYNAGKRIGQIEYYLDTVNGDYDLSYQILPDSTSYKWRLMATGTGSFDLWNYDGNQNYTPIVSSGLPSSKVMPDSMYYKYPDRNKSLEGVFQNVDPVITVGSYDNRHTFPECGGGTFSTSADVPGRLTPSSSVGPTRDGRFKPDVCSPGALTVAAVDSIDRPTLISAGAHIAVGCYHARDGGTSFSSPGVAGIVALYLQKKPTATAAEIQQVIINSAYQDVYTGNSLPNQYWGYGKANAFAALTGIPDTIIQPANTTVCENSNALIKTNYNRVSATYQWQVNQGGGFNNLSNTSPYSGVTANTLTISPVSFSLNGYSYRCIIGNPYSCKNKTTNSAILNVDTLPTATAGGSDTICQNATATVNGASATKGAILWTNNGTGSFTSGANTLTPVYAAAGGDVKKTVILTMTITSTNTCNPQTATATYSVTVDSLPGSYETDSSTIGYSGTATVSGASATNGSFVWGENGAGSIISGATTLSPTYAANIGDAGNTVKLTMTVTSTNTCAPQTARSTYLIHVKTSPTGIESFDPTTFSLLQNVPNPFNLTTTITFTTPVTEKITFAVVDILGRTVYTKDFDANQGLNSIVFSSSGLTSGTYYYSISDGKNKLTKGMVILND